jgi:hypothetical protein
MKKICDFCYGFKWYYILFFSKKSIPCLLICAYHMKSYHLYFLIFYHLLLLWVAILIMCSSELLCWTLPSTDTCFQRHQVNNVCTPLACQLSNLFLSLYLDNNLQERAYHFMPSLLVHLLLAISTQIYKPNHQTKILSTCWLNPPPPHLLHYRLFPSNLIHV